jgi:hypothetical protein
VNSEINKVHENAVRANDEISLLKSRLEEDMDLVDKGMEELRIRNSRLDDKLDMNKHYFDDNISKLRDMISKTQKSIQSNLESVVYDESAKNLLKLRKEIENKPATEGEEIKYILKDMQGLKHDISTRLDRLKSLEREMTILDKSIKAKTGPASRFSSKELEKILLELKSVREDKIGKNDFERSLAALSGSLSELKQSSASDMTLLDERIQKTVHGMDDLESRIDRASEKILLEVSNKMKGKLDSSLREELSKKLSSLKAGIMEDVKTDLRGSMVVREDLDGIMTDINNLKLGVQSEIEKMKKSKVNFYDAENRIKNALTSHFENDISQKLRSESSRTMSEIEKNVRGAVDKMVEARTIEILGDMNSKIKSTNGKVSLNAGDLDILNQKLRDLEQSVSSLSRMPDDINNQMKKFRHEVTAYMNDLAHNYDSKFKLVKHQVEASLKK